MNWYFLLTGMYVYAHKYIICTRRTSDHSVVFLEFICGILSVATTKLHIFWLFIRMSAHIFFTSSIRICTKKIFFLTILKCNIF